MNADPAILPSVEVDAAWAAAAQRVELYLRAHGLVSATQISRLAAEVIAIARSQAKPGVEPMALAMETLEAGQRAWFAQLLPAVEVGGAPLLTRGRVALTLGEVSGRWPSYFMSGKAMPMEMMRAVREAGLGRSPDIKLSNMAPRQIPPSSTVLRRLRWQWSYPFLRIVTGLMVVLSLLGATVSGGR